MVIAQSAMGKAVSDNVARFFRECERTIVLASCAPIRDFITISMDMNTHAGYLRLNTKGSRHSDDLECRNAANLI